MDPKSIPAFPSGIVRKSRPAHDPGADFYVTDFTEPRNAGMTLRDYFAAKAMHALIVEPPWSESGIATVHSWSKGFKGSDTCDRYAFAAYAMADAMLAAR